MDSDSNYGNMVPIGDDGLLDLYLSPDRGIGMNGYDTNGCFETNSVALVQLPE